MSPSRGGSHPFVSCRTQGFAGFALKHSPFYPDRIALASSQNYGLVGNGRLHVLRSSAPFRQAVQNINTAASSLTVEKVFDTQDGLYDAAWSELHENQLVTGSGDGSIKLWDITLDQFPINKWHEHTREVYCVDWNNLRKEIFASCSWDQLIKIWTPERPTSMTTIKAHSGCIYNSIFAPHSADTLASCAADGLVSIWDLRAPPISAQLSFFAHPTEVLCLDWNKYMPTVLATGSVDRSIRIHDLRLASTSAQPQAAQMPRQAPLVANLLGHEYAVRKVGWSPFSASLLASASYDMTCRVWDINVQALNQVEAQPPIAQQQLAAAPRLLHDAHTEFVVGLSWSLFEEGVLASCSWDGQVHVFGL